MDISRQYYHNLIKKDVLYTIDKLIKFKDIIIHFLFLFQMNSCNFILYFPLVDNHTRYNINK
ncbi:hypothetical protein PFAG_00977 [Plasmodium falciparum Santa Lucia]|uniref:Uncharacterized protein n=2 Tax=Plasmodium falciparum TaxID=5833 RepID=W7JGJ8_PLAFA|nr:hypothetical protein PFAG_00977 [Plasmodium falciparum Santa Lucia]EWC78170.1 hypothetical protein C923_01106 [Plasmodium falciparum UGT5.1]